jgi:hypothetical protein
MDEYVKDWKRKMLEKVIAFFLYKSTKKLKSKAVHKYTEDTTVIIKRNCASVIFIEKHW